MRFFARTTIVAVLAAVSTRSLAAQDTTFRGITIAGKYDPFRDKVGIVVLPVAGANGDSVRAIVERDLDFSDRFNVVEIGANDADALRGTKRQGLNYPLFARLGAAAVIQIVPIASGFHVALHDVGGTRVANVDEFTTTAAPLSRNWRLALHNASDEIERWITGQKGISSTRIEYWRAGSLHVIDADGANDINLPTMQNGYGAAWNPAGNLLVYNTFGASGSRLVLLDLTTGRSRTLLGPERNTTYISPVFSPGGASVVYSKAGENGSDVYSVNITGNDAPRQLTVGRGTDNTNPTFSPDGQRIAFTTGRLGRPELYIMDADGLNADVLTNYDFSEKNYRSDPDWSPDGRLVAYQERINDRFQIRTIPVRGGTPKLLTSEGENEQPSWAPDSRHLVFTSDRTGVRQLWILDTESGRMRQLTKLAGSKLAAWSPRLAAAKP